MTSKSFFEKYEDSEKIKSEPDSLEDIPAEESASSESAIDISDQWYVIQVRGGTEHVVMNYCNQHRQVREEIFVPLYKRKKKFHGIWTEETSVLFPGYVFIATDDVEDLFDRLRKVPKLTKILKTGEEFVSLYPDEVKLLNRLAGKDRVVEMSYGYIEGDDIMVTEGPMKGWEGRIKRLDRHKRTGIIQVQIFGQTTEVTVGLEIVKKSPSKEGS